MQALYRPYKYTCCTEHQRLLVNGQTKGVLLNEKCATCDKYFLPKNNKDKYCSSKCRLVKEPNFQSNFAIFRRDGFKCIYCGKSSIEDGIKLAVDHIIAIGIGGKSDIGNLITCCKKCNSGKNLTKLPQDILERIFKILKLRNDQLSEHELTEVQCVVNKFAENDHQRIMRLSFKLRYAIENDKKSA